MLQVPVDVPVIARPFVKWVGGKGAIAEHIQQHLPQRIERYYELFAGSAALFFRTEPRIEQATLCDTNLDLMLAYKMIQGQIDELIDRLYRHQNNHNKEYYYGVRAWHNLEDPLEIAARMIYLNKTCYNGLFRVNSKGEFNAPMGSYTNPKICDEENLRACNRVLQAVDIISCPFNDKRVEVKPHSVVYCDPPYHETYNGYHADRFDEVKQKKLAQLAQEWAKHSLVVISNSETPLIRQLYSGKPFVIHEIEAPRYVNCKGSERGKVQELLIVGGMK